MMIKAARKLVNYQTSKLVFAALLWVGGSTLFGLGFGIAFFGDPAPWKGAAAFGLWGLSTLLVAGALRLAGFWKKEE